MQNSKILVVDDNCTSLALVSFLLSHKGHYQVLTTPNPRRALEIVRENPSVKVVVSDIEMPELRGTELVREIRENSPATGCILMSASAHQAEEIPQDIPLLTKPIDAVALFAAVKKVLTETIEATQALERTLETIAELTSQATGLKSELEQAQRAAAAALEESQKLRNRQLSQFPDSLPKP